MHLYLSSVQKLSLFFGQITIFMREEDSNWRQPNRRLLEGVTSNLINGRSILDTAIRLLALAPTKI